MTPQYYVFGDLLASMLPVKLSMNLPPVVTFIDSHTEGEPTRVIDQGDLLLEGATIAEKAAYFAKHGDDFRKGVILEPRGSDVLVGALLLPPTEPDCLADVIFFNNKGVLGMCGHGTIGLAETLRADLVLAPGKYKIGTRVGVVEVDILGAGRVAVENVPAFVYRQHVEVAGFDFPVVGDIAYGGNWFFLTESTPCPVELANHELLSSYTRRLMAELNRLGITGANGAEIDHIEVFGPPTRHDCRSKNFVMCPGGAFDRSPCGTGTSAKVALLAAEGKLKEGESWGQESIVGSSFSASYRRAGDQLIPRIEGSAYLTGRGTLLFTPGDPFVTGIGF